MNILNDKPNMIKFFEYASALSALYYYITLVFTKNFPPLYIIILIFILALPPTLFTIYNFLKKLQGAFGLKYTATFIMGILAIISGGISLSLAKHLIHSAMQLDPSFFPSTLTILSAIFLIPSWALILSLTMLITGSIMMICYIFLGLVNLHFQSNKSNKNKLLSEFSFFIGYTVITFSGTGFFDFIINTPSTNQEKFVYPFIQRVVVALDYYGSSSSECKTVHSNQRFAYLEQNYISLETDLPHNKILFTRAQCNK